MTKTKTKMSAPMSDIYARLEGLGLPAKWVKSQLLPGWFEDEMAAIPATRAEIEIHLAQALGLQLTTLRAPDEALRFVASPQVRFKSHRDAPADKRHLARALGARLGHLAIEGIQEAPCLPRLTLSSAHQIRAEILNGGAPWVGLQEILTFCWSNSLPVVHATLPPGLKKWDGMALSPGGRPVILSFCARKNSAWQAFIIVHELGHHCLGHVGPNGEIFDADVKHNGEDEEEIAANAFAVTLLTGGEPFALKGDWPTAPELADIVWEEARERKVHPGVILLNLMHHHKGLIKLCMATLALVDGGDATRLFESFYPRLGASDWKDDDFEFFERLSGAAL